MRNVLTYTGLRLLLFGAALGVLYLLGGRGMSSPAGWLLLAALALLVSGPLSFLLLTRQREAMSGAVVTGVGKARQRVRNVRHRLDEGAAAEDSAQGATKNGATKNTARQPEDPGQPPS